MTFDPVALSHDTPVDLVDSLSLTVGRNYGAQYQGPGKVNLREAASGTAPGRDVYSSALPSDPLRLTPKSGEGIWAWVGSIGENSRLAAGAQIVVWEE